MLRQATKGGLSIPEQIEVLKHLKQGAAAYAIDSSGTYLSRLHDVPRSEDGTYDCQSLFKYMLRRSLSNGEGDDEFGDGRGEDSPELRRQRLARAKLYELELGKKRGDLVDLDRAKDVLGRQAEIWRRFGQWLFKMYGVEAQKAFERALDDCQAISEEEFGGDDGDVQADELGGPGGVSVLAENGQQPDPPEDNGVG